MIGNAHLDPAWVWSWQEGSAETKATIRSALQQLFRNDSIQAGYGVLKQGQIGRIESKNCKQKRDYQQNNKRNT